MKLGERLYNYRRKKGLSQEDVAAKLNVSRQTVSKWETDQTLPDLDKIESICELFEISTDELLKGKKEEVISESYNGENKKRKALIISGSILLYFIAIIWIILSAELLNINPGLMVSIFMLIIGLATVNIVYYFIANGKSKKEKKYKDKIKNKKLNRIVEIVTLLFVVIYLGVSFITFAWYITWILWPIFALVVSILKLIFDEDEDENE